MTSRAPHLLLLAGSGESRVLAARLAGRAGLRVTASLRERPRTFGPLPVPTRVGRFDDLKGFLEAEAVTAVLDATHPFAVRMGHLAAAICADLGMPYARVLRPPWTPEGDETWAEVPDEAAVRHHLTPGARVFATTGRATLAALAQDVPARFLLRQMAERAAPPDFKNVEYIIGKGPFSAAEEIENLRRARAEVLVAKNSGGAPSRTKIAAAHALGLPMILIARPAQPPGPYLETVSQAMDWTASL